MNEFDQSFKRGLTDYAAKIASIYLAAPADTINCLRFGSVCGMLNETYLRLVKEKELPPIEEIDEKTKTRIWLLAKGLSEDKKRCIEISRSIYLLESIT
jgi:hypothetical protein